MLHRPDPAAPWLVFLLILASALPAAAATRILPLHPSTPTPDTRFELVPPHHSGVTFTNTLPAPRAAQNQILLNGSGVTAGDADQDGWTDLFFAALNGENRLFLNRHDGSFRDATEASGTRLPGTPCTGAAFVDVDGDGALDLLINTLGKGTHLLRNQGAARFTPMRDSGLTNRFGPTSLTLADIDRDGDLDLYVTHYRTNTIRSSGFAVLNINGRRVIRPEDRDRLEYLPDGRILEHGEPDLLYLNDGHGHFTPVSWTDGHFLEADNSPLKKPPFDWSLSAAFRDWNDDGWPDLYVCGDFHSPDRIWINQGSGRFRAAESWRLRNTPTFSMSVDFADINRDGHDDFFVADMLDPTHELQIIQSPGPVSVPGDYESTDNRPQVTRNTLQLNRGDGTFAEIAAYANVHASGWTWNALFLDADLDGFEDLLVTTGHMFDTQDLDAQEQIDRAGPYRPDQIPGKLLRYPPLLSPLRAFRNQGNLTFVDRSKAWGLTHEPGVWQGACLADLDNDGDLDFVINRLNGPAGILLNRSTEPRIAVRLRGLPPNTRGVGARIHLHGGPVPHQSQVITAGGRYLSSDDPIRVFAAGNPQDALSLEVRWPSGQRAVLENVLPNHLYELDESDAHPAPPPSPPPLPPPLFTDESGRLGHRHFDPLYDDFQRQPLLPRRLSQAGPGVGWIDVNSDGREDLFIASGRAGRPGLFLNAGDGGFQLVEPPAATHDQIGVAPWHATPGATTTILVASSAYEAPTQTASSLLTYDASGNVSEAYRTSLPNVGPIAPADVDGDGDLDLFLGAGPTGGHFPSAAPSLLLSFDHGRWNLNPATPATFNHLGWIQAARWTDLDRDGFPELVLACGIGPIRLFRNSHGTLTEITRTFHLDTLTGWWNSVQAGDFDNDGRMDLIAGNWGLNVLPRPTPRHPLRLHFGNLAGSGQTDLVETTHDPDLDQWVPQRDLKSLSASFPWLRTRFPTHHAFARASVAEVPEWTGPASSLLETTTFESIVLLNRGDHFEPKSLPPEAQFAPVFGIDAADFNLDGHVDLFLAQNLFAVSPAVSRQDAGRGLLLLGHGDGTFTPQDAATSGIALYGEQRGSAWGDYNADGRPDLVVTQNRDQTRLFRNQSPREGLRIALRGSPGNPHAIGATLRLSRAGHPTGPVHEIHAGGGYASAPAPIACLPRPVQETVIEVIWPGGAKSSHPVPKTSSSPSMILRQP